MSTSIDNKVVSVKLDNSGFEDNAKKTMKTSEELEKALRLGDASGLKAINEEAKKIDLGPISAGADAAAKSFSALGTIGFTVLQRLTNAAIDLGKNIVTSLSSDQIGAGFQKYESMIQASQVLVNSTGKSLAEIEPVIDRLMEYTDETSYDFADMITNIGKFTSNGVEVEQALNAMMGIANWAALSGQNAEVAGHAMYNLSQAIGVGALKLLDWRSIQNYNMGTPAFKEAAIQMGILNGAISEGEVTIANFDNTLASGWLSSDILLQTLGKFSDYTVSVMDAMEEYGVTFSEAMELVSETGMELSAMATKSAYEAKSFSDAIAATQDAVSTGWLVTWKLIFGNYEEATHLWTQITAILYELFAAGAATRNQLLKGWKDLGGRDSAIAAFYNLLNAILKPLKAIQLAWKDVFPGIDSQTLYDWTERFRLFTESLIISDETMDRIRSTARKLFTVLAGGIDVLKMVGRWLGNIVSYLTPIAQSGLSKLISFGTIMYNFFTQAVDTFKKTGSIAESVEPIMSSIMELANGVTVGGRSLSDGIAIFTNAFKSLKVPEFSEVIHWLSDTVTTIIDTLSGLATGVNVDWDQVFKIAQVVGIYTTLGLLVYSIVRVAKTIKSFGKSFGELTESIGGAFDALAGLTKSYQTSVRAEIFKKIATSVLIIAAAFYILSKIDVADIRLGLETMVAVCAILLIFGAVASKVVTKVNATSVVGIGFAFLGLGAAFALMAYAIGKLTDIIYSSKDGGEAFASAIGWMIVIIGALTGSVYLMKGAKGLEGAALAMIALAAAVLILVIAFDKLQGLAKYDMASYWSALVGVLGSIVAVGFAVRLMSKVAGKQLLAIAGVVLAITASMLLLYYAIEKFGSLGRGQLQSGFGAIAVIFVALALGVKLLDVLNIDKSFREIAIAILAFTAAIFVLYYAVKKFSELSWTDGTLAKGLGSVAIMLLVLAGATKLAGGNSTKETALVIAALAASMLLLYAAVLLFSTMRIEDLVAGGIAVVAMLMALGGAVRLAGGESTKETAIVIGTLAVSVLILYAAVLLFSTLPLDQLISGGLAVVAMLLALGGAARLASKAVDLKTAAVILALAVAMLAVGGAVLMMVEGFNKIDVQTFAQDCVIIAAVITVLAVAAYALMATGADLAIVALGLAMLSMSAAVLVLAIGFIKLNEAFAGMDFDTWANGINILVHSIAKLSLWSFALTIATPFVILMGVALAILGVGLIAVAGAAYIAIAALEKLVALLSIFFPSLAAAAETAGEGIPKSMAEGIESGNVELANSTQNMCQTVTTGIANGMSGAGAAAGEAASSAATSAINATGDAVSDGLDTIVDSAKQTGENIPGAMMEGTRDFRLDVLDAYNEEGEAIGEAYRSGVYNAMNDEQKARYDSLTQEKIIELNNQSVKATAEAEGAETGTAYADSMSSAWQEAMSDTDYSAMLEEMGFDFDVESLGMDAGYDLSSFMGDGFSMGMEDFDMAGMLGGQFDTPDLTSMFSGFGSSGGVTYGDSFGTEAATRVGDSMEHVVDSMNMNDYKEDMRQQGTNLAIFFNAGWSMTNLDKLPASTKTVVDTTLDEIEDRENEFRDKGTDIGSKLNTGFSNELGIRAGKSYKFDKYAGYIVDGLTDGVDSRKAAAATAGANLGKAFVQAFEKEMEIASPSAVMAKEGRWIVKGLAEGITEDMSAEEAIKQKAANIVEAFETYFDSIDLKSETRDLQYKLWESLYGDTATAEELKAANVERLEKELDAAIETSKLYAAELRTAELAFGTESDEYTKIFNKYLEARYNENEKLKELNEAKNEIIEEDIIDTNAIYMAYYELYKNYDSDYWESMGFTWEQVDDWMKERSGLKALEEIQNVTQPMFDGIEAGITDYVNDYIGTAAVTISDNTKKVIEEFGEEVTEAVSGSSSGSLSSKTYSSGTVAGTSMAQGFTSGVTDGTPKAEEASSSLADVAYEGVMSTLWANSPSKRTYLTGQWFVEGFTNGIADSMGMVLDPVKKLGETASELLAEGLEYDEGSIRKNILSLCDLILGAFRDKMKYGAANSEPYLLGKKFVQDLAKGITNYISEVKSAATTLAETIQTTVQTALAAATQTAKTTMTIEPVVDLDEVSQQAASASAATESKVSGELSTRPVGDYVEQAARSMESLAESLEPKTQNVTYATTNTFTQTNNSPKAISSAETYRQTKNLFNSFVERAKVGG